MNNDSRNIAARSAMLLAKHIEDIRHELQADPAYVRCEGDPLIVALLMVLCNTVMHDANWDQRQLLFESFSGCKWPESTKARQRIEEVLDGVNLRADQWRFN